MYYKLFPERLKLLTIHPARTTWRFTRRKLTIFSKPAQVPLDRRVTDSESLCCLTNAKAALQHSFDDPFT